MSHGTSAGTLTDVWMDARAALRGRDKHLDRAMDAVAGNPRILWISQPFTAIVNTLAHQNLPFNTGAARYSQLVAACGGEITPEKVQEVGAKAIAEMKFSAGLANAIVEIAGRILTGKLRLDDLANLSVPELQERLSLPYVKGWSWSFFREYHLKDPDVLLSGDVSLRNAVKKWYGYPDEVSEEELQRVADAWRPYRSAASWFIYKAVGITPGPQPVAVAPAEEAVAAGSA